MKVSLVENNNAKDNNRKKFKKNLKHHNESNDKELEEEFLNKDIIDLINYKDDKSYMKKLLKKEYKSISKDRFHESKTVILKHAKFAIDAQANMSNNKVLTLIG